MFKENCHVEIIGDPQRYRDRAEELGHTLCGDLYIKNQKNTLCMYVGSKKYNILQYPYFAEKQLTQEEFFGETQLKQLDNDVLNVLVQMTCETLDSFSAYDVTSILRKRLPNVNIVHEKVKTAVSEYVRDNNLNDHDNGTYHVYSKKTACCNQQKVSQAPQVSTTFSNVKDQVKQLCTELNKKLGVPTSLKSMTVNTNPVVPMTAPKQGKTVTLQTEYRINLTDKVRQTFPGVKTVYLQRDNNKITILINMPYKYQNMLSTSSEIRVRTGFKTPRVQVLTYPDRLEVVPV